LKLSAPTSGSRSVPRPFARRYDAIYADKDFGQDVTVFESLAGTAALAGKTVLEIGAGTGNHTLRLAQKVGKLVSVEIDADFAAVLRAKLAVCAPENLRFFDRPVESLSETGFDAAVAFFHVVNYVGPDSAASFLAALAARLKPGAHFVADLWNGSAALLDPPREEVRRKTAGTTQIVQHIRPRMDAARRTVTLNYEIALDEEDGREQFTECIELYLWLREELASALQQAGFSDVTFWDYRLFPASARPDSWRLWLRAVRG